MGHMRLDDPLGHLIPPGTLTEAEISRGLIDAMDRKRFSAGLGVPSVPTRFVVTMHPSDRAYLDPRAEDRMADALARHADRSGWLVLGSIDVEFRIDRDLQVGRPRFWVGFAETDLLVLADADAAAAVFAETTRAR